MKKIAFIILIFISNFSFSQISSEYLFSRIEFGSSLTYIWEKQDMTSYEHRFNEYTWNLNSSISILERLDLGVQVLTIFTKDNYYQDLETYNIFGFFSDITLLKMNTGKIFGEISFNHGDYGTIGKGNIFDDPYRVPNLNYLGIGFSLEILIYKRIPNLYFELGAYNYVILNDIDFKYNYTQYIIGLNYIFGKTN